jgi:hypothetical protein
MPGFALLSAVHEGVLVSIPMFHLRKARGAEDLQALVVHCGQLNYHLVDLGSVLGLPTEHSLRQLQ